MTPDLFLSMTHGSFGTFLDALHHKDNVANEPYVFLQQVNNSQNSSLLMSFFSHFVFFAIVLFFSATSSDITP
jgi:hypothetical protein